MKHFVGVDWGSEHHFVCVLDECGEELFGEAMACDGEGLTKIVSTLIRLVDSPEDTGVVIEDPSQPIVGLLQHEGFQVFHVNPRRISALRDAFSVARKKSDSFDAWTAAEGLRTQPQLLRKLEPMSVEQQELQRLWRHRASRVDQRLGLENELRALLKKYFPQFLSLPWGLEQRVMLDLLEVLPSQRVVSKRRRKQVERALGQTRKLGADEVIEHLRKDHLGLDERTLDACVLHALDLVEQLKILHAQLKRVERVLEDLAQAHQPTEELSDMQILQSAPGLGPILAIGLLAEAGDDIASGNLERLRNRSIAPVTRQTGKQKPLVARRWSANRRLLHLLYLLGTKASQHSEHYRAMYARYRARGHSHGRAARQIADRLLTVIFAMLRDRTLYDPKLHGATRAA